MDLIGEAGDQGGYYEEVDYAITDDYAEKRHTEVRKTYIEIGKAFEEKFASLIQHFDAAIEAEKTLVVARSRDRVDKIGGSFWNRSESKRIQCVTIHGSQLQWEREQSTHRFERGFVPVMVATHKLGNS